MSPIDGLAFKRDLRARTIDTGFRRVVDRLRRITVLARNWAGNRCRNGCSFTLRIQASISERNVRFLDVAANSFVVNKGNGAARWYGGFAY